MLLDLAGAVDLDKERARLSPRRSGLRGEIGKIEQKLANAQFVAKAKPEVIEEQREREADCRAPRSPASPPRSSASAFRPFPQPICRTPSRAYRLRSIFMGRA